MGKTQIIPAGLSFGRNRFAKTAMRITVMAVFGAALWIDIAHAIDPPNACDGSSAPDCQQVVAQGSLGRLATGGWALYCPSSAPYYWNNAQTAATRTTSFTEDPFVEGGGKVDFTMTNWSLAGSSDWAISIDCSPIDPSGGSCTGSLRTVSDPGCAQSDTRTTCTGSDTGNCWLSWEERCISGSTVTNYSCTTVLGFTQCTTCQ